MDWARILAFVTGMVDQVLLARNEYLAAENRILKAQLKGRLKLSDADRATLAEIGHRLGRRVLGEVANVARPDKEITILAAAFDEAWGRIQDDTPYGTAAAKERARRRLGKRIIDMAKVGERDPRRLCEDALAFMAQVPDDP